MIMVDCVSLKSHRINHSLKVGNNDAITNNKCIMLRYCANRLHRFAATQQNTKHRDKD